MAEPEEIESEGEESGDALCDGECYFYGGLTGFCEKFGVIAVSMYEGGIFVYSLGHGYEALGDFLKRAGNGKKPAEIRKIKG